jgi:hypothetical protein
MFIKQILEAHHDEALPRGERIINDLNIGDAFLYRHHPLYRNLRDCYWELGYRFDTNDFCYLFDLPLFSLDLILKERKMPVRDTVTPLHHLTGRFPEAVFTDLSFDSSLAYPINHVLHHSVHCVGDFVTNDRLGSWAELGQGPLAVLRMLMCESFANTLDVLANIDANRGGEIGRNLFIMNNLVYKTEDECEPYTQFVERVGMKVAIQIVALFFLFRNLLAESIDEEFLADALQTFGVAFPPERAAELLPLFETTRLTEGFRIATTTRYFRYIGLEFQDLLTLYDFDLLEVAREAPGVAQAFDVIADLIAFGSESEHLAALSGASAACAVY